RGAESWVELNPPADRVTPLPFSSGGEEYLRLLREAQRDSTQSSARHSLASSRRDTPRDSPKSPPNSPNTELSTEDDLKGVYINYGCNKGEEWTDSRSTVICFIQNRRYAETHPKTPPSGIQNTVLLCELHKGFFYQPSVTSELYVIVTPEEWAKLTQFYEVDHEVTIKKVDDEFVTNPDTCAACMLARVEQERLDSLKYDRATIYIKCIDDSEDNKSENDSETSAKRPKIESCRPSRTRRKVKGSHELKVSSENTLKDLKVMTMQICGAGPYDQHLMLGEHELTDHSQSLASLGIFPGSLLTLKIDTPLESEADMESDSLNNDSASPEKGFKGTELVTS
ncbi:ubiquitin carboxyl-terminal hydrolase 48-like, partial [Orussus abietinus]|uniref:ubiquitin carboxyl-terminal hydrolase 48-like n=1 Tax=Orussus abietinus TaxID=222816 RepID=UPI000C715F8E